MRPARGRGILGVLLVVGIVAWAVLDAVQAGGGGSLPVPWTAPVGVGVLAAVVLVAAFDVRRWVTGRRERALDPLVAFRVAVLAKAAAYTGGALAGWYLAQAIVLVPDLVGDRRPRFFLAVASALAGMLLAAAGLIAQRWCRRPTGSSDRDDADDPEPRS